MGQTGTGPTDSRRLPSMQGWSKAPTQEHGGRQREQGKMAGGKVWLRCFLAFSRELQGAAGSVSRSYGALDCLWNRLVTAAACR